MVFLDELHPTTIPEAGPRIAQNLPRGTRGGLSVYIHTSTSFHLVLHGLLYCKRLRGSFHCIPPRRYSAFRKGWRRRYRFFFSVFARLHRTSTQCCCRQVEVVVGDAFYAGLTTLTPTFQVFDRRAAPEG